MKKNNMNSTYYKFKKKIFFVKNTLNIKVIDVENIRRRMENILANLLL